MCLNSPTILNLTKMAPILFFYLVVLFSKTNKVALNNFVEGNDETEWLYWKLYL